jgi:energy-coupling factor transporter ATP-binding protein EcfA2
MFKLDVFLAILIGIVSNLVVALIVGVFNLLRRRTNQEPDQSIAAKRLFSALQKYEKNTGPSFSPALLSVKIPLEYVNMSNPLDKANSIVDIYQKDEDTLEDMLLLGKTGSGKSTSLKELTLKLIENELKKGKNVENANFPIFLSLGEWSKKKKPLKVWLKGYLTNQEHSYLGLDKRHIDYWASKRKFILLMDGLDEMSEEDSHECLNAIHKWRQETHFSPVIISCQLDRYEALEGDEHSLKEIVKKVVIQKLKPSQAQDYLEQRKATELSHLLYQDEKGQHLKEIADTPLLLDLLVQTITGKDLKQQISEIETEDALWKKYVNREIDENKLYNGQGARYWLIRLAKHMGNSPTFYFQPDSLPGKESQHFNKAAKSLYKSSTWLIIFLFAVASCLLVTFGGFPLWQLLPILAIIIGFYGYLFKSILTGLYMILLYFFTLRFLSFSWESSKGKTKQQRATEVLIAFAFIFSPVILLSVIAFILEWTSGIPIWSVILAVWLIGGLFWYVFYRLRNFSFFQRFTDRSMVMVTWFALRDLMVFRQVDEPLSFEKLSPKLSGVLIKGMFIGIIGGLIICFIGYVIWQTNLLALAILVGMSLWLDRGLGASIRGYILRFWFWRTGILPWNTEFLDDVGKLLVKQGNRYKFSHDALKNYLAKKWKDQQN